MTSKADETPTTDKRDAAATLANAPTNVGAANPADAQVTELEARPGELLRREAEAIKHRREAARVPDGPPIGIAVSGGGIRSATFALGVFQSLARSNLLRHVDYLSTVSGGGYFGSFLGALYKRHPGSVESVLSDSNDKVIRYLRENGRYLAPGGSSDLLLGGAVLLRNWVALQVLLASFLLFIFLAAETVLLFAFSGASSEGEGSTWSGLSEWSTTYVERWLAGEGVWLSPWFTLPALVLVALGLPLGWSYWTLGRGRLPLWFGELQPALEVTWAALPNLVVALGAAWFVWPISTLLGVACIWVALFGLVMAALADDERKWMLWLPFGAVLIALAVWYPWLGPRLELTLTTPVEQAGGFALFVVAITAILHWLLSAADKRQEAVEPQPKSSDEGTLQGAGGLRATSHELSADSRGRHRVSTALRTVLVGSALLLGFALVETLGRSIYLAAVGEPGVVLGVSGGVATFFWACATFARKVVVSFSSTTDRKRPRPSVGIAAWAAAVVVLVVVLAGAAFATQAITWQAGSPTRGPDFSASEPAETRVGLIDASGPDFPSVDVVLNMPTEAAQTSLDEAVGSAEPSDPATVAWRTLWFTLVAFAASVLFGSSRVFLNRSTHLPLYSARLTRAYLGASNPRRISRDGEKPLKRDQHEPDPQAATRVMPGDDIPAREYWGWGWDPDQGPPPASAHWAKGAPLHIVNVTINETVDGRSQIQQSDRKGLGLAIGPCALSAGVHHHLLPGASTPIPNPKDEFRVFRFPTDFAFFKRRRASDFYPREQLTLGQWMSVSGAAFSTGLGSRTNQGMSLLAGFTNVRLGYWWRPGIEWGLSVRRFLGSLFWVQSYLFREMLARFPGTQNTLWYLSDGGHFENMGGYELIRRRLPFIVIIDGEADPNCQFEGLGNLVRKARIDFGAEIDFAPDPFRELDPDASGYPLPLGPLAHLRRGKWTKEGTTGTPHDWTFEVCETGGHSLARAALARVCYTDEPQSTPDHWLLYIKPTLLERMPADLEHYSSQNPEFPNESTGDQFFDEAQWESYRKLGELTGKELFRADDMGNPKPGVEGALARLLRRIGSGPGAE
jgi:hypothetical protein